MTAAAFGKSIDGSANPRAVSIRVKAATASIVGGQNAHDLRKGAQPSYVDKDRVHLNRVLIEPLTGPQLRQIVTDRRATRTTERALKLPSVMWGSLPSAMLRKPFGANSPMKNKIEPCGPSPTASPPV